MVEHRGRSRGAGLAVPYAATCHRRVALLGVSVQVWFAQDETVVRPGEVVSLSLAIENVGDRTESYTIIPAGLTAAWTTVTRPNVTLFGGSRDVVEVWCGRPRSTPRPPGRPRSPCASSHRTNPTLPWSPRRSSPSVRSTTGASPMLQPLQPAGGAPPTSSWWRTTATTSPAVASTSSMRAIVSTARSTRPRSASLPARAASSACGSRRPFVLPARRAPARLRDRGDRTGPRTRRWARVAHPATHHPCPLARWWPGRRGSHPRDPLGVVRRREADDRRRGRPRRRRPCGHHRHERARRRRADRHHRALAR